MYTGTRNSSRGIFVTNFEAVYYLSLEEGEERNLPSARGLCKLFLSDCTYPRNAGTHLFFYGLGTFLDTDYIYATP